MSGAVDERGEGVTAAAATSVTIGEILTTRPFRQARPEVVVAGERRVSWVHSSEIYEIATLLDGGEMLLTTGLGLVGADEHAMARYAESIAERGAAALALELGRTFTRPPIALVEACARSGLTLIVFHAVVPFVRLARTANEQILDHEAEGLRRADALSRTLHERLLSRRGLHILVDAVAAHVGVPVQLVDLDGRVHAGPAELAAPKVQVELALPAGSWGRLVASDSRDPHLQLLLSRAAQVLQLALTELRSRHRRDEARALVLDLVHGPAMSAPSLTQRAARLRVPVDQPVTGLVVGPAPGVADEAVVRAIEVGVRRLVRVDLVAAGDGEVLAVVDASAARREVAKRLLAVLDAELAATRDRILHLAVGSAVTRLHHVPDSFAAALLAATTARRRPSSRRLLLPPDVALEQLLLDTDETTLEKLVTCVLGPLLDHDATARTPLLPTLLAYLAAGRSKAAAAARLGVRRQTVHERLSRATAILDLPDGDATALATLDVAALAWQVRNAGSAQP
jgi:PucR family transcriptional regulator, purine catabolism regulatory protein